MKRATKPPTRSESDIKADILDYCKKAGIFIQRRNVAGVQRLHGHFVKLGTKGQADFYGVLKPSGRHFECELKKPGEVPSEEQKQWLADCEHHGALAFWTDSLDGFIAEVERGKYERSED